jgi:nucleoside-diphosphate-sugar epimerase
MKRRLLLIGSGGFLGRNIRKHISKINEFEISTWDQNIDGNFLNSKSRINLLNNLKPDIVINSAWLKTGIPNYENNKENINWGKAHVDFFRECSELNVWYITFGSSAQIKSDLMHDTLYAKAKNFMKINIMDQAKNTKCTFIYISYLFSIYDRRPRILDDFLLNPKSFKLKSPNKKNDFIEVQDAVNAVILVLLHNLYGNIEVKSGIEITNQKFLDTIYEFIHNKPSLFSGYRHLALDEKLYAVGWRPRTTRKILLGANS